MSKIKNTILFSASAVVVLGLAVGVLNANSPVPAATADAPVSVNAPTPVTRIDALPVEELRAGTGKLVGYFSPNGPHNSPEYDAYTAAAGVAPNIIAVFGKWDAPFPAAAAERTYQRGAVPMISWESWAKGSPTTDPAFSSASITSGAYDEYIAAYAAEVAAYGKPVLIRFNHEMNGSWYPWGINVNGNSAEGYQAAWRHVHDIFTQAGAANASWIWSVNTVRAIPDARVPLAGLYPGDEYVDFVGMTGYAVPENNAAALYQPTIDILRAFTAKPIILTEIGAQTSGMKAQFIASLFPYIAADPSIRGFVWFQTTKATGGSGDWALTDSQANIDAYRAGATSIATTLQPITHEVTTYTPLGEEDEVTPLTVSALK